MSARCCKIFFEFLSEDEHFKIWRHFKRILVVVVAFVVVVVIVAVGVVVVVVAVVVVIAVVVVVFVVVGGVGFLRNNTS